MVELDHTFQTGKDAAYNLAAILDLERVIPCVEGGKVLERESPDLAKAEIKVKMGAMSMVFKGTVEVASKDEAAHRAETRTYDEIGAELGLSRETIRVHINRALDHLRGVLAATAA